MLKVGDHRREERGEAGTPAIGPRQPRGRCQVAAPSGPVLRMSVTKELLSIIGQILRVLVTVARGQPVMENPRAPVCTLESGQVPDSAPPGRPTPVLHFADTLGTDYIGAIRARGPHANWLMAP